LPDAAAARGADALPVQPASAPTPAAPVLENSEWEKPLQNADVQPRGPAPSVQAPPAAPAHASRDAGARRVSSRGAATHDAGLEAPPPKPAAPRVTPRSARIGMDQF
jgi:hypothetical protein